MRCLIIDDDESPRRLLTRLIERSGHSAVAVRDGRAAEEEMHRQAFDVAIVDLELGGESGTAAIGALRQINPHLRVLVVSGYDDRRHVLAALEAGADGYIVKDEVSESLTSSLQSVRAGYTPLSPRVAAVMLRQLRKALPWPPIEAKADSSTTQGLARVALEKRPTDLAAGTGSHACIAGRKPVSDEE
ncbi:MAG TPA: response regulator [Kofleriaceae bacterium]|nr:response regulator [Kofleriaceae bacterium]